MKSGRLYLAISAILPCVCYAANNPEFAAAAKLLTAAKNADIQQVQSLINSGADVNYVDSTGLSLVCTAIMNNDTRAVQILQMYGADASQCDRQIKKYKNLNNPKSSSGVFSGLSSTQGLVLSAGAGAAVVGGVLLLTDVFNPSNGNGGGSGSGGHGGGGGGDDPVKPTPAFTLPYGPLLPDAASETANYRDNLNVWGNNQYADVYKFMTGTKKDTKQGIAKQNYLLMMHGYSPFARGYMGQRTLRDTSNKPLNLSGNYLGDEPVTGGRPVNIALVSANGINTGIESSLTDKFIIWGNVNDNNTSVTGGSNTMISSKYYNNVITLGTDDAAVNDDTYSEDSTLLSMFDLAGYGTVINNENATPSDNLLAKIVAGRTPFGEVADYVGFLPNGQLSVFRTGNGRGFVAVSSDESKNGTYTKSVDGFTITFGDDTWSAKLQSDGSFVEDTESEIKRKCYIGNDGMLYIDNTAYVMSDDNKLIYSHQNIDYMNYKALVNSAALYIKGDLSYSKNPEDLGRSRPTVFANAAMVPSLRLTTAKTIDDVLSENNRLEGFLSYIDATYNVVDDDDYPAADANELFTYMGKVYRGTNVVLDPILLFSTGAYTTNESFSGEVKNATFENAAPLVYSNLEHSFMSVVSVMLTGVGTNSDEEDSVYDIYDFSRSSSVPSGKYALTQWQEDGNYYKSRICGMAGTGTNAVDPWCFAAAGTTDERGVAAAAGAVGVIQGAFSYLTNEEIYTLLALTADGAYLNYDSVKLNDKTHNLANDLESYLDNMYELPLEYQNKINLGKITYLDAFKEVFGYGIINLERATTPGKSVYYYDGSKIVSTKGNAYWRTAIDSSFNLTGPFGARSATISAPFYDVLTSVDGEMSMPRIWENEFTLGVDSKRGLYMGDVLGDFKVRKDDAQKTQFGNMEFSMAMSQRPYADNLNGLDNLSLSYDNDKFGLNAGFQRYFTDGQSRFSGLSNPVLGLATNAIVTGGEYKYGNWSFGARAFSGSITDESFLQNDPTVSAQYEPLRLGLAQGGQSNISWNNDKFSVAASFGVVHETDTVLGAQTTGLLDMGNGDTTYVDVVSTYKPIENVSLTLRSTFARTRADATGGLVLGLSELNSNAFAFGADVGNFSFSVSRPLAITDGNLQYAYAKYDIAEINSGKYDLVIADAGTRNLDLSADVRETRLMGAYRHNFGEFTDGALGFIYRINPNNTNVFGNESIFMLKLTHRLGI